MNKCQLFQTSQTELKWLFKVKFNHSDMANTLEREGKSIFDHFFISLTFLLLKGSHRTKEKHERIEVFEIKLECLQTT